MDGIPDFFIAGTEGEAIDAPNQTWLDPKIVVARDTVYRLCTRTLKGMAFCMRESGSIGARKPRRSERHPSLNWSG